MLISLWLLTAPALADVPPPFWYREDCEVAKKEGGDTTCEACLSWHGAGEDPSDPTCGTQYEGTEFSYVCQTRGASTWTEVWCDGPPREGRGCASGPASGALGGVGLVLFALARRRPRR